MYAIEQGVAKAPHGFVLLGVEVVLLLSANHEELVAIDDELVGGWCVVVHGHLVAIAHIDCALGLDFLPLAERVFVWLNFPSMVVMASLAFSICANVALLSCACNKVQSIKAITDKTLVFILFVSPLISLLIRNGVGALAFCVNDCFYSLPPL